MVLITHRRFKDIIHFIAKPGVNKNSLEALLNREISRMEDRASFDFVGTESSGHAIELAREAAEKGTYTVVVAVGGDGMVYEVGNGLVLSGNKDVAFGVVPEGHGNDFARRFGIRTPEQAVRALLSGQTHEIDAGCAHFSDEDIRYYFNTASIGLGPLVVKNMENLRFLGGSLSYFFGFLMAMVEAKPFRVYLEGKEVYNLQGNPKSHLRRWPGDSFWEIQANIGKFAAAGMQPTPYADDSDGLLDVFLLYGFINKVGIIIAFPSIYSGKHLGLEAVECIRVETLDIKTPYNILPVNLDGETAGVTPVTFWVLEKALKFRGPELIKSP